MGGPHPHEGSGGSSRSLYSTLPRGDSGGPHLEHSPESLKDGRTIWSSLFSLFPHISRSQRQNPANNMNSFKNTLLLFTLVSASALAAGQPGGALFGEDVYDKYCGAKYHPEYPETRACLNTKSGVQSLTNTNNVELIPSEAGNMTSK